MPPDKWINKISNKSYVRTPHMRSGPRVVNCDLFVNCDLWSWECAAEYSVAYNSHSFQFKLKRPNSYATFLARFYSCAGCWHKRRIYPSSRCDSMIIHSEYFWAEECPTLGISTANRIILFPLLTSDVKRSKIIQTLTWPVSRVHATRNNAKRENDPSKCKCHGDGTTEWIQQLLSIWRSNLFHVL